jgi:drug/metabolite transporter (DMT)-like permease
MKLWVLLAITSAILFGLGDFLVVYSEQQKMDVITLYVTYTIIIGLINLIYLIFFRKSMLSQVQKFTRNEWAIVAGLCVMYFLAYMLHFVAIQQASNPGYANALVMFHVIVLTALSYWFLSKPVNMKALIGVGFVFVGGWLITLFS